MDKMNSTSDDIIIKLFTAKFKDSGIFVFVKDDNNNIIYPKEILTLNKIYNIINVGKRCLIEDVVNPFIEIYDEKNNKYYKLDSTCYTINNRTFYVDLIEDISRQKYFEMESRIDYKTGVYNSRTINLKLEQCILNFGNQIHSLFVAIGDIDNFKKINDTYSHLVGDIILKEMASIFEKYISNNGYVGRWGGDEFIFILKNLKEEECLNIINGIANDVKNLNIKYENKSLFDFSLSIGCCFIDNFDYNISNIDDIVKIKEKLLSKADESLYDCKNNGKSMIKIYKNKSL